MATVAATAKSYMSTVIFNPGVVTDSTYFDYADTIVQYESPLASYTYPGSINAMTAGKHENIAIVMNKAKPRQSRITSLVNNMISQNIGSVYLTSDCCYNKLNGTLLTALVRQIATNQNSKRDARTQL